MQVRKGSSFGCNRYPPLSPSRGAVSAGKGARNGTGAQSLHARRVQAVQRVYPEPRTDNRLPSAECEHSQSGLPPSDGWRCATVTTRGNARFRCPHERCAPSTAERCTLPWPWKLDATVEDCYQPGPRFVGYTYSEGDAPPFEAAKAIPKAIPYALETDCRREDSNLCISESDPLLDPIPCALETDWLAGAGGFELRNSERLGTGEPSYPEMLRQRKPVFLAEATGLPLQTERQCRRLMWPFLPRL